MELATNLFEIYVWLTIVSLVGVVLLLWHDLRWYKRHPGVEKRLGEIDEEMSRRERR